MANTLRERILDHCNMIINFRVPFTPKGNRYILAANEIANLLHIDNNIEAVIDIARIIEASGFDRDTLLGSNDRPEVTKLLDSIIEVWKNKYFHRLEDFN